MARTSREGRAEAVRLYRSGARPEDVVAQLGLNVHPSTVVRWAGGADRTGPRGRADLDGEEIARLRDREHLSWDEIALRVSASRTAVRSRYELARNRGEMSTHYLVALVATDLTPSGEFSSGEVIESGAVRVRVLELLAGWGHAGRLANAQMTGEAETAGWQLDRWRGAPMRLCGHVQRIDVYPVDRWDGLPAGERTWRRLRDEHDRRVALSRAHAELDALGIPGGDPDRAALAAWLVEGDLVTRAFDLRGFAALSERPEVASAIPAAYRRWQWILAAAESGEPPAVYERELLREITRQG